MFDITTKLSPEEISYFREQIKLLKKHALRNTQDEVTLATMTSIIQIAESQLKDGGFMENETGPIAALHYLSSLVDKSKTGGWIADRSAVYRVECAGRTYRNTDLISVQMADKDHHGADGLFARAREVAAALNLL